MFSVGLPNTSPRRSSRGEAIMAKDLIVGPLESYSTSCFVGNSPLKVEFSPLILLSFEGISEKDLFKNI